MADEAMKGTYWQKVQDKEGELSDLYARMDTDKDLYYLDAYKMKYLDGKEVPKTQVHNLTMNEPALFAHRAIAILQSAFQQIEVEGKGMTDSQTSFVEKFCEDMTAEADNRLSNRGIPSHYAWNCEHMAIRGRVACRVLVREDKKTGALIPDVVPLDTRYVTFENDMDGLLWLAYETYRSADKIEQEYGTAYRPNSAASVLDIYTRQHNEVWIDKRKVKEQAHPYQGEVPAIYERAWAGSMLADSDAISHEGESIFALNRNLYPEFNKAMSVLQTLNMMTFLAPLQYQSEAGAAAELPDQPPYGVGAVIAVEKTGGFMPMPITDVRNATRYLLANLQGALQRGSLPNVDYGNLSFPLSAVAIARLTESKDQIFVPRLQALAMFYRKLYRMIIRQVRGIGHSIEVGEEGHKGKYDPKKLQGDYQIYLRYYSQSPEQVIANYQVAQAAALAGVSRDTIFRDILRFPNPHDELLKRQAEDAEEFVPTLKLYRYVQALWERGRATEANIIEPVLLQMLAQQGQQQPAPVAGGKKQAPVDLVPLLEGGGGRTRPEMEGAEETMVREEGERQQMAETNRGRRQMEGEVK